MQATESLLCRVTCAHLSHCDELTSIVLGNDTFECFLQRSGNVRHLLVFDLVPVSVALPDAALLKRSKRSCLQKTLQCPD